MCRIDSTNIPNELLPGLPNSVVLGNLLHRLPWYSRPVLRAVSKAWHAALTNSAGAIHIPNATSELNGLLLIHPLHESNGKEKTGDMSTPFEAPVPLALSMYEEDTKRWRLLPPIQGLAPCMRLFHDCGVASAGGKVYVMGGYDASNNKVREDVFVLDIRRGKWVWEKCKPMRFARCQFTCRAHEGKIYVVGGQSTKGEPEPEAYEMEKDEWEVLPRVLRQDNIEWATAIYKGLAIVKGSVIAHGYWESQTGNVMRFYRRYDERERRWKGLYNINRNGSEGAYWANWRATCSNVAEGVYDMRGGWLAKFKEDGKGWEAMEGGGALCERAWCHVVLEGDVLIDVEKTGAVVRMGSFGDEIIAAQLVTCISISCVHNLVVSHHNQVAYTTLCKGDPRFLSLWQGHIDHSSMNVKWTKLALPHGVSMCSAMCSFEP